MVSVLVPALAAAVFPSLLAGVIVILQFRDPRPLLVAFLAGGWLMSMASGLVIVFVLRGAVSTSSVRTGRPAVNLTAGALSLLIGLVIWLRRNHRGWPRWITRLRRKRGPTPEGPARPSRIERLLRRGSVPAAFVVGAALNPPGIWYLVALNSIASRSYNAVTVVLVLVLFNAIMFVLAEAPLIGYLVSPATTSRRVQAFQRWLSAHLRPVAAVVAFGMGIYFITKGALASG